MCLSESEEPDLVRHQKRNQPRTQTLLDYFASRSNGSKIGICKLSNISWLTNSVLNVRQFMFYRGNLGSPMTPPS